MSISCAESANVVDDTDHFIYSCKSRNDLNEMSYKHVGVFAECGIWLSSPYSTEWTRTCPEINNSTNSWNDQLIKILSFYLDRVPLSEIKIGEVGKIARLFC